MAKKGTVLSGSTTSGDLTLGNFIGAVDQWTRMTAEFDCYFMVANLHSLTEHQDPKALRERTQSFFAQYIALGLDPAKCSLFVQSMVPEHAELTWVLTNIAPLGQLEVTFGVAAITTLAGSVSVKLIPDCAGLPAPFASVKVSVAGFRVTPAAG